ncbi:MAG: hypothetical protein JXA11_12985 [Phycisphaerae bacterium]|nr:hypothetical protein [Phycisphaerae bacterium]
MRNEETITTSLPTKQRPALSMLLGMLLVLTAVEAAPRVWLIVNSDVIAQDGTYFLRAAKAIHAEGHKVWRELYVHPGYPAAVVAVHSLLVDREDADDQGAWERAGQYVALTGSVLAIWAVWAFGAMIFRDVRIGFFGALLFGLGRKFASTGADVLSDSPMLCFAMWGLVLALRTSLDLRERRKRALFWSAGVGILSAAGYWVRPEGAVVLLIAVVTWGAIQLTRRLSWRLTLGAVAIAGVTAVLTAAPYGVSAKWNLKQFFGGLSSDSSCLLAWLGASELTTKPAGLQFISKFFEAQHPIPASLTCVYLLLWCVGRSRRAAVIRATLPIMTRTGGTMIALSFVWIVPPIVLRYWSTGAMSHRYLFLSAAMLAGLPVAAIAGLARLATLRISEERKAKRIRQTIFAAAVLGLAIGLTCHTLRPLHDNHLYAKQAGVWLAERKQPGDRLLTDYFFVGYYSGIDRPTILEASAQKQILAKHPKMTRRDILEKQLNQSKGYRYVALIQGKSPSFLAESGDLLKQRGYLTIKEFPYIDKGRPRPEKRKILVFEKTSAGKKQDE